MKLWNQVIEVFYGLGPQSVASVFRQAGCWFSFCIMCGKMFYKQAILRAMAVFSTVINDCPVNSVQVGHNFYLKFGHCTT